MNRAFEHIPKTGWGPNQVWDIKMIVHITASPNIVRHIININIIYIYMYTIHVFTCEIEYFMLYYMFCFV